MSNNGMTTVGVRQFQQTAAAQAPVPQFGGDRAASGLDRNINESTGNTTAAAMIQARFAMAMRRPRSWMAVREAILKDCQRPSFAATAIYQKPVGKGKPIEGFSVRFVERMMNLMGNIAIENTVKFDGESERLTSVEVIDLETNVAFSSDVVVSKTIERREPNGEVLGSRRNSQGREVYIIRATDDDVLIKQAALVSKAMRTLGLRMVPGDILDEARSLISRTLSSEDARDPDASRKALLDGLARQGVPLREVERWLGHSADQINRDEFSDLRAIGMAISEGETTWRDVMNAREEAASQVSSREADVASSDTGPVSINEVLASCVTPASVAKAYAKIRTRLSGDEAAVRLVKMQFVEKIGAMMRSSSPEMTEEESVAKAAALLDGRKI